MQVRLGQQAQRDLDDIHRSISADRPTAADRIVQRILKKLHLLGIHPQLGAAKYRYGTNLRVTTSERYVIYYQVDVSCVEVLRIIHGYRDHGPLLEDVD